MSGAVNLHLSGRVDVQKQQKSQQYTITHSGYSLIQLSDTIAPSPVWVVTWKILDIQLLANFRILNPVVNELSFQTTFKLYNDQLILPLANFVTGTNHNVNRYKEILSLEFIKLWSLEV